MSVIRKQKFTRDRLIGRMTDGSDAQTVSEIYWSVTYRDDDDQIISVEFDHDPTSLETNTLAPRRAASTTAFITAVDQWQAAQTAWGAATTTVQSLAALHLEHIAIMRALRALAVIQRLDD